MATSILLNVDDHEVARYARTRLLKNAGYVVHEAGTAAEAFEIVAVQKPDLILLDVHLPDLSGLEVSRRLKEAMGEDVFIIIQITASALLPEHAATALDLGADVYLTEPVDPEVLLATVRAMLRLQHVERSLVHAKRQLQIKNKELERSNADLGHFAFAASHDLMEPLRTISLFTEVLREGARDRLNADDLKHLDLVMNNAERMRRLITDLLGYASVGRSSLAITVVSIRDVADSAVANIRGQIDEAGATVLLSDELPEVLGDFTKLSQVFQNLLSNSLKYRDHSTPLTIRIAAKRKDGAWWEISVEDDGPGIPAEYQETVFAPFRRLHGQEIAGTGLGLALCRRVIESHGGTIYVESSGGRGARFVFTLSAG